jgi:predicted amidohydrolase YtcJ
MSQNEKPLPKPPSTPFSRKRAGVHSEEQEPLTADRMAQAMAEGKLDEFLQQEMPDNEAARKMATMMMGMTGMMSMEGSPMAQPSPAQQQSSSAPDMNAAEQIPAPGEVPEDVRKAIESGDVKGLKELLRREYLKRTPGAALDTSEAVAAPPPPQSSGMPTIDKDLIDAMVQIAKDNSVTMDWMILRAIKVYVEEYRKTGRL